MSQNFPTAGSLTDRFFSSRVLFNNIYNWMVMNSALGRELWSTLKSPKLLLLGKESYFLCISIKIGRKELKEAKKTIPVRMSTTIGGSQERRRRKLGVGCSVDLAVKVIRKAESWLCPCKRMKLKTAERRVPLFGSLF